MIAKQNMMGKTTEKWRHPGIKCTNDTPRQRYKSEKNLRVLCNIDRKLNPFIFSFHLELQDHFQFLSIIGYYQEIFHRLHKEGNVKQILQNW